MAELIEVLNENGDKTGQIVTRDEVHREGFWHRIAVVAVIDSENRILLQQRSQEKITNPGKWDVAAAGHVAAGEDSLITAMRETAEEIGIEVNKDSFRYAMSYQKTKDYDYNGESMTDRQFFDCFILHIPDADPSKLKLQTTEVQAVKLSSLDEFKQMIADGVMINRQAFYDKIMEIMEVT